MQIRMTNSIGCKLHTWESLVELVNDIRRGYVEFAEGDRLEWIEVHAHDERTAGCRTMIRE